MHIRYGYSIDIRCERPTPLVTLLDVHPAQRGDITQPDDMEAAALEDGSPVDASEIRQDRFGNLSRRILAPAGGVTLRASGVLFHTGFDDQPAPRAVPPALHHLPEGVIPFLCATRYCETDRLSPLACDMFGHIPPGWEQVEAICAFVRSRLRHDPSLARPSRTAREAMEERTGVARDFAHLAIALCRGVGVPARYCAGYFDEQESHEAGEFDAWFEVFLGHRWHAFDARGEGSMIGRILVAIGRDALDVSPVTSFGAHRITRFEVSRRNVQGPRFPATPQDRQEHWTLQRQIAAG